MRAVESGARTIDDLVSLTAVSSITIRRDLAELAERGLVHRIRGGAAPATSRGAAYPFSLRQSEMPDVKRQLARGAAALCAPGDSVVIDNGTTALAVAEEIAGLGVTAMALSLHAAAALASRPGNEVIVPGGTVTSDDLSLTGGGVADAVRQMRFDVAIIGACAAHPDHGLTVAGWEDAHVKRAVLASATKVILVVSADKLARTAAHRFGTYADLDTIVTTDDASFIATHTARELGVTVQLVGQGEDR